MPWLWRLYRAEYGPGLDGIGGTFADGRWHTRGARVVYFGASAAIVVVERLAHTDPDLLPDDLRLACFESPQIISAVKADEVSSLPENWIQDEDATRRIGGEWLRRRSSPLLLIPSGAGYTGNWLRTTPETFRVTFRQFFADWEKERPMKARIDRLTGDMRPPVPPYVLPALADSRWRWASATARADQLR